MFYIKEELEIMLYNKLKIADLKYCEIISKLLLNIKDQIDKNKIKDRINEYKNSCKLYSKETLSSWYSTIFDIVREVKIMIERVVSRTNEEWNDDLLYLVFNKDDITQAIIWTHKAERYLDKLDLILKLDENNNKNRID